MVPLLPIPNRKVKRLCADDSADSRVKVGHCQANIAANARADSSSGVLPLANRECACSCALLLVTPIGAHVPLYGRGSPMSPQTRELIPARAFCLWRIGNAHAVSRCCWWHQSVLTVPSRRSRLAYIAANVRADPGAGVLPAADRKRACRFTPLLAIPTCARRDAIAACARPKPGK